MRPLLVVLDQPIIRDLLRLLDRFEDVGVEDLGPVRPIEALDERVLVRLAGRDEVSDLNSSVNFLRCLFVIWNSHPEDTTPGRFLLRRGGVTVSTQCPVHYRVS